MAMRLPIGMVIIAKAAAAAGICDSAVPQMIETALVNNICQPVAIIRWLDW